MRLIAVLMLAVTVGCGWMVYHTENMCVRKMFEDSAYIVSVKQTSVYGLHNARVSKLSRIFH